MTIYKPLVIIIIGIAPFSAFGQDTINCWQDVESVDVLSTSGGRFCREQELESVKAEMQRYFERSLLIAEREDREDEKVLGIGQSKRRVATLRAEQERWLSNMQRKCEGQSGDPETTGYPARILACEVPQFYLRIIELYPRSQP